MNSFIKPTIGCKKKNLYKYLTYRKRPKNEIDFGIKNNEYLRYYFKCKVCGHLIAKHKKHFLEKLYDDRYFTKTYKSEFKLDEIFNKISNLPKINSDNYHRIKRIKKYVNSLLRLKKIDLIDIGSGTGIFPISMIGKKYNVTALDPDKTSINYIKKKSKSKVKTIHGDFLKIKVNKLKKFNLVTFNKVLEHVEDPIFFLKKSIKLLKKQNLIYVEVPSVSAINDKQGKEREELHLTHHHVFSKQSLENIFQFSKIKLISIKQIREPSGKYTLYALGTKNNNYY